MQFLAVVKMYPSDTPTRITFAADDYSDAVKKMCSACRVPTTSWIHEYDLLEIVTGGYRPIAQKNNGRTATEPLPLLPAPSAVAEGTYTPYSVFRNH